MSTTSTVKTETESSSKPTFWEQLMFPYGISVLAQLPMLLIYVRDLWGRPHYRFAPFAVLATIAIVYARWPRNTNRIYRKSLWSMILLAGGLVFGIAGYAFMTPWFTACSVMLLVASFLAGTIDLESGKSLWPASLPLFIALVLPSNYDFRLITWLQRVSAGLTSRLLDLLGMGHHMPGTIIEIPGKTYNIENACSGVQSFFTLLFVAVVFAVWNRRSWFRGSMLVIAAVLWAIFMNTIRILMIPIVDRAFGVDLSTGVSHDLLGYTVLAIGILLLLSTDQFLLFLFGPVEVNTGRSGPFGRALTYVWNNILAGDTSEDTERRRRRGALPVSPFGRKTIWTTACLLGLIGAIQFMDVIRSYATPDLKIQFFASDVTQPFEETDMPLSFEVPSLDSTVPVTWSRTKEDYLPQNRARGSDLGLRSDTWKYTDGDNRIHTTLSLDQTFPGWHELTVCYQHDGWELVSRIPKEGFYEEDGKEFTWGYIEAEFTKKTGEHGFLIFSHFDAFGKPLAVPTEWGKINSFFIRAKNRLSHRIRGSLFQSEAYQTQVFVNRYGPIADSIKEAVRGQYLFAREEMRTRFLEKRKTDKKQIADDRTPSSENGESTRP